MSLFREVRGVSIPKGVNCFDYCAKAHVIVTGGADKIIRAWHPHIYARPTGCNCQHWTFNKMIINLQLFWSFLQNYLEHWCDYHILTATLMKLVWLNAGKLIGHLFTIVDITCNEKDQQLISVCTGRIIRVWDIQTLTPLQVRDAFFNSI